MASMEVPVTAAVAGTGEPPIGRSEAIEQAVARKVTELRRLAGLSQARVGERMAAMGHPWHQSTFYKIETGRRPVRVGELADLATVFGVTPATLLADDDYGDAAAVRGAMERALREQIAAEILSGGRSAEQAGQVAA